MFLLALFLISCSEERIVETLQDRNGVKYAINEDVPFTGKLINYWGNSVNNIERQRKRAISYRKGEKHGFFTTWFENGQKERAVSYRKGKKHGFFTTWFKNGQKEAEMNFKDGKEDGMTTLWGENGKKKIVISYKEGKQHGLSTTWYENGQKAMEENFVDGKNDRAPTLWDKDGQEAKAKFKALEPETTKPTLKYVQDILKATKNANNLLKFNPHSESDIQLLLKLHSITSAAAIACNEDRYKIKNITEDLIKNHLNFENNTKEKLITSFNRSIKAETSLFPDLRNNNKICSEWDIYNHNSWSNIIDVGGQLNAEERLNKLGLSYTFRG